MQFIFIKIDSLILPCYEYEKNKFLLIREVITFLKNEKSIYSSDFYDHRVVLAGDPLRKQSLCGGLGHKGILANISVALQKSE
ncbi:hypothetical protein CRM22_010753, partial [Opisthorchis felineus]